MVIEKFELKVKVIPQSSKNEIVGFFSGALKVKLTAPPVDGQANKALLQFLKKHLKPYTKSIEIKVGHTSKNKTLELFGERAEVMNILVSMK